MKLNREQERAASFIEGKCVVISGPGGGKTRTMMERIGKLVTEHGVAPENILGLTFTRNAAEEMRQRLVPVLGDLASRVTLSTIHSWCYFLLKSEGKVFEILSGKDQILFVRNVMKQLRIKNISIGMILSEISLAKNNLVSVEEFRVLFEGDKTMQRLADVYDAYDREKARKYLLDFDDLLLEAWQLLGQNPGIRDKWTERYFHILVDEFQDSNIVQVELLKTLVDHAQTGSSFFVVGDDWQSIYAFTGASVGNILNFEKVFKGARVYILNLSYRSTPQILRACQNLIRHNKRKIEKTLVTHNEPGEDVIILESSSEEGEALSVLNEIEDLVKNQGYEYKSIAVIYRANFQSLPIETTLSQHKIPYHIHSGLNFYNRPEIRNLLDYLRVINDPLSEEGDEALVHILNIPNRYVSRKLSTELQAYASEKGIHLFDALKEMRIDLPYVRKNVKEFVSFLEPLVQLSKTLFPAEVINLLRNILDYDRWVTDEDLPAPDDVKIQNLNQLQLSATRYSSIKGFLEYVESFQEETVNDKEGVALMTIHRSKGMEFPAIFLIGMCEGILPSKKGDIEEERRICFVGMSRAMKLLFLSWSHTYLGQPAKKSLFLDEILGVKQAD